MFFLVLQRLILEAFLDIFYFPIWWYGGGLKAAGLWCLRLLKSGKDWLSPDLWLRHIFTPMYGQYDFVGRVISFFMRLVQIIFRTYVLFLWFVFCLALFLIWLAIPIVVAGGLILSASKI